LKRKTPFKKGLRVFNPKMWVMKIKHNQPLLVRDGCDDELK